MQEMSSNAGGMNMFCGKLGWFLGIINITYTLNHTKFKMTEGVESGINPRMYRDLY